MVCTRVIAFAHTYVDEMMQVCVILDVCVPEMRPCTSGDVLPPPRNGSATNLDSSHLLHTEAASVGPYFAAGKLLGGTLKLTLILLESL